MSARSAVERDLKAIHRRDRDLADGTLAASALVLAEQLDDPANSATSKSLCAKELRETMATLRHLLPAETEDDSVDELRDRRERRRAGGAGA